MRDREDQRRQIVTEVAAGTDGLCSPRHQTHLEPLFLELNGIL